MPGNSTDSLAKNDLTTEINRLSVGVGTLYFCGYTLYVLTLLDAVLLLPPVFLTAYLFWRTPFDGFRVPTLQRVGLYLLVIPGGAIAVELLFLLILAIVFQLSWILQPVAWYQRQWLDVVGFVGPLPFLVYTLGTVVVATILALAVRSIWHIRSEQG